MKKILLLILTVLSIEVYSQNPVTFIGGNTTGGNPVLTNVTAADTTRWGAGGSDVTTLETRVDSIVTALADTVALGNIITLKSDTVPLFIFGGGGGNAADTTAFTTSTIYGAFYNTTNDTLQVTNLRGIVVTGSGTSTCGVQISWHATFKSGSATNLNTSAFTVNSTTTGSEDTSFNNSKIPPNVWVWCTTPTISVGNKPSLLIVTLSGYYINGD